jgi:tRNA dimethylallyltransferase
VEVLAIVGPTAVGKSAVASALAELRPGTGVEIVNGDAMQLYRGLDIGTAKVGPGERVRVPHHLLDIWEIGHRASVVEYAAAARSAIDGIVQREALPVVVGGSGLYLSAALDQLQVPPNDPQVRTRYEELLARRGPLALHAELAARDPAAAAAIDPRNGRRIVRALEVVELTGSFTASLPRAPRSWRPTRWIGLRAPLPQLDDAINRRVEQMWVQGLEAEVVALAAEGLADSPTAGKAVGYAECLDHLQGRLGRDEAIARTALRTRQLARRQLRWFRRDGRVQWIDVDLAASAGRAAVALASLLRPQQP